MEGIKNIDYRGIGEGLSITHQQSLSPSEPVMSKTDDWQALSLRQTPPSEPYSDISTTESAVDVKLQTKSSEGSSTTTTQETSLASSIRQQYFLQTLSPLERYCCHVQAHEQRAVGQITDRQSLIRLIELDDMLCATARILPGCAPQLPALSSSIPNTTSGQGPNIMPTIDSLMKDSVEFHAASQEEQAERLRKIDKLRRRLKIEGGGRVRKSARVRKRSKAGDASNDLQ
ncbi:hypothetical protein F5Y07DRAFT_39009 [Xylaria sp. FL0933]|nr:hypothetical protein F5Y07DRAFT_39009 [Xylaria sp. FL0933]